jgi:molybdenum cofactor guanylyltransferase
MTGRAAIILAGGKGERFQCKGTPWQDKALVLLFGKPLLVHTIESVRQAVEEIVVCVNDEKRKKQYVTVFGKYGLDKVKLVIDEKFDHLGGPLVAIYSGLHAVDKEFCFTLPGDMPLMQPQIIEYMFKQAADVSAVVPTWPNGRLETLSMVLKREPALEIAQTLCLIGRPRTDDLIRGVPQIAFVSVSGEIAKLDPKLESFVNINSHQDLERLQPRETITADKAQSTVCIQRGTLPYKELEALRKAVEQLKQHKLAEASENLKMGAVSFEQQRLPFWAALTRENEAKSQRLNGDKASAKASFLTAADNYALEAQMHDKCNCTFLADRARNDASWCQNRANELSE